MACAEAIKGIVDQMIVQLKTIDGSGSFTFDLDNRVFRGFKANVQPNNYPTIYVAGVRVGPSNQTDQVTYETGVEIEFVAYVKNVDDPLSDGLNLVRDIELAIYEDESLDESIYDLSLSFEVDTFDEKGIVGVVLSGMTTYSTE